ncbi:MAG: nuclease, partial [Xanthobacteraceae bacterium]
MAAALFALGVAAGAVVRPSVSASNAVAVAPAFAAASAEQTPADIPLAHRLDPSIVYPAEVIRIIDGDTFEARVRVWPGLDVDTKVRLRGVDAAELHARCASEFEQAQA